VLMDRSTVDGLVTRRYRGAVPDLDRAMARLRKSPAQGVSFHDEERGLFQCEVTHPVLSGWRVCGQYLLKDGRLVLIRVWLQPNSAQFMQALTAPNAPPLPELPTDCVDGVTKALLEEVRLGDLLEGLQSHALLKATSSSARERRALYSEMVASPNPGRNGRDDLYYAEWARLIHQATMSKKTTHAPISAVADQTGITRDQVRDLGTKAKARGLYMPRGRGLGGGFLTDHGQTVLRNAKRRQKGSVTK